MFARIPLIRPKRPVMRDGLPVGRGRLVTNGATSLRVGQRELFALPREAQSMP